MAISSASVNSSPRLSRHSYERGDLIRKAADKVWIHDACPNGEPIPAASLSTPTENMAHELQLVRCYEEGGVFLFDEIDAADANTLLVLNAALANGRMALSNRPGNPVAIKHADFVCIAAANTFGTGADRQYVGRSQLDESTLDRFRIGQVEMDYDADVEATLCPEVAIVLADLLEEQGHRVEVWAACRQGDAYQDGAGNFQAVCLKRADQPVDIATLTNAVSGWCYRTLFFQDRAAEPRAQFESGMGHPLPLSPYAPSVAALAAGSRLVTVAGVWSKEGATAFAARTTYACRSCEQQGHDPQVAKAALPQEPIPKSGIEAGLLAHVVVSKIVDHLPLHRQESILARHGWDVRRSTLCDHLQKCGILLTPFYQLMHRRLLRSFAIHADDTPLLLLRPRRTAYAWVYLGDAPNPYTLFDLTAGRSQTFPQQFLESYRGFVHADAFDGYNAVHNNVRHLGCWMHARRYFVEAEPSDPRAVEALAFIRTLYAVEREIKDERERLGDQFSADKVVRHRQSRAGPILATFSDWLEEHRHQATPKSLFGQAVEYSRNQWPSLVRYVSDSRFAIDNGEAERAIRPLAVGRANWLHVGGDGGLKTASVLLSVCASATRHRLNPWAYLRDVLDQLAARSAGANLNDLLPDAWASRQTMSGGNLAIPGLEESSPSLTATSPPPPSPTPRSAS